MIGIKGVGMTALSELLLHYGAKITGSDIKEEFHTDLVLQRLNIQCKDFKLENITPDVDMVIYSSAYEKTHLERRQAEILGIPQLSYGEVMAQIFNEKKGIMVAGSHGKTTTTALLGHMLAVAGLDPTVVVGGTVVNWNSNVRIGKSKWMVVEGDEYQKKFLLFKPHYLLITNIDYDHPDTFPNEKSYRAAFNKLISLTKVKYWFGTEVPKINFIGSLMGEHNKKNVGLVVQLARELNIKDTYIQKAIQTFGGVRRRCEIYHKSKNLVIMDDYAHHPTEIKATLKAIRDKYPDYLIKVLFQPHTYSRTQAFLEDFARAFINADEVILFPTYSSIREGREMAENIDISLYQKVHSHHSHCVFGIPDPKKILQDKRKILIITMGAGDVWQMAKKFISYL